MTPDFLFYLLAAITLAASLGLISCRQPVYAALWLIVVLIALAGLFALLSNLFLFTVQIILYAGGVMTLILFILMFLNIRDTNIPEEPRRFLYILGTAFLTVPFILVTIKAILTLEATPLTILSGFGNVEPVGLTLFNEWVLPFELISILLLVALVGAVTLGRGARRD